VRIATHDQSDFLGTGPSFELLLTGEGLVHIIVGFSVQQADDFVAVGETFEVVELMLENTAVKISADADVKGARKASHDVGAIVSALSGHETSSESFVVRGCDGCHKIA
jgi:hypothetical protein